MSAEALNALGKTMDAINDRINGLPNEVANSDVLKAMAADMAKQALNELLLNPEGETAQKLKSMWAAANQSGDARLKGSKYAKWGVTLGGIEAAYDLLKGAHERGHSKNGPSEELTNCFNHLSKGYFLTGDEVKNANLRDLDNEFQRYAGASSSWSAETWKRYDQAAKAMDSAESGFGSQLIGAQYAGDLWMGTRRDSRLFSLVDTVEMTAPTMYIPCEADLPEMLFVSENTDNNSSDYTTVKTGTNRVTLTAKKLLFHQMWSGEMEEDSIVPFIELLLSQIRAAMGIYTDSLYLNGDTTNAATGNINLDDADPADTKHYLAFDGIRHAWLVDATGQGIDAAGAVTWDALQNLKQKLVDATYYHDWGNPSNPGDCVFLADPETGNEIGKLSEVLTAQNYLDKATVLTGEVAKIGLNPLVLLPAYKKTEADGKLSTTGGNNTKGQVSCFNRRGIKAGWRRQVKVETERLPGRDQTRIVYSMRLAAGRFSPTGAASGIKWTSGLYNITVAT